MNVPVIPVCMVLVRTNGMHLNVLVFLAILEYVVTEVRMHYILGLENDLKNINNGE
jgi:hypothetical protein